MKIRNGFVSNSSATSFYFMLNGGKEELLKLIEKYGVFFDFPGDKEADDVFEQGMDVEDLICALKPLRFRVCSMEEDEETVDYDSYDVAIISTEWAEKQAMETFERYIKDAVNDKESKGMRDMYKHFAQEQMEAASKVGRARERGLNNLIIIDMGDHSGEIQGGLVGNVMDYRGRDIHIDKEDFMVFTRQNR